VTDTVGRSSVSSSSWWGVAHTPGDEAASRMASASGQRGSDRLHTGKPYRLCAARQPPSFDSSGVNAHRLRGRSPVTGTAVEQRFLGRKLQLVDPQSTVGVQADLQQPSRTRRTHRRGCQECASKKSQTQITALGRVPSAVIPEPVTSSVGQDVLSGIVGPLRLAFLLLDLG
jgi:hypothetical protein